jgi:hypothetical protein
VARVPDTASNVWAATTTDYAIPAPCADIPPRVYVPHELGGDVAVIDPLSMQIVDRFWVGRTPTTSPRPTTSACSTST